MIASAPENLPQKPRRLKAQFFWLGWISHRSMFPQVSDSSVRVRQIAGLGSCRTTADILLVHNHSGLTDAAERWSTRGTGLGVRGFIACVSTRSLAVHVPATMQCDSTE